MLPGVWESRVPFLSELDVQTNKHFESLPVGVTAETKLLGLRSLASVASNVRNNNFYLIPLASILALEFAFQSLRGNVLRVTKITDRSSRDLASHCCMTLGQSPYLWDRQVYLRTIKINCFSESRG